MAIESDHLLTYEDFLSFPDDNVRREIIEGEVFVTPSPIIKHQDCVGRLHLAIGGHLAAHGGGRVFIAPLDVLLGKHNIVEPDLIFVAADRLTIIERKNIVGAPTLLVEVVSDPRTDRVRKRALYEKSGVPEYWIVDPDADRVEVYLLDGARYAKPIILEVGDALTTPLLPGLSIDIAELFADA